MDRRTFLSTAAAVLATHDACLAAEAPTLRVAVIGHTGRGNYGHGLDTVWLKIPKAEVVGVADADPEGLAAAAKRLNATDGFADYRRMLKTVKPDVVAICPRHPDQHLEMAMAAMDSGAKGIYMEKPFCRDPKEADQIIAASDSLGVKVAIAHRNRYHPTLHAIDKLIAEGAIGKPLEIRGRGKGDQRGGAEDLWVLGTHVLNLIHYFGGKPKTCSAILRQDGRSVGPTDMRPGNEALGPMAGNEVHARFELENGLIAYFDSIANDGTQGLGFGLQILGSDGLIDVKADRFPLAHLVPGNPFQPTQATRPWIPISSAGAGKPEPIENLQGLIVSNIIPVRDLLNAIGTPGQPLCDAREGAMTVELVCSTFASHLAGGRAIELPLASRSHPFEFN